MGEVVKVDFRPIRGRSIEQTWLDDQPSSAAICAPSPTSIGAEPVKPRADRFLRVSRARFVLGFAAGVSFFVGWWLLGAFFTYAAIFGRSKK